MGKDGQPAYVRGRLQDVLGFFWATPGRAIRIEELEKHFKDKYNRNQLMATMAHVCGARFKDNGVYLIEKLGTGIWRLNEPKGHEELPTETEPGRTSSELLMVEVLKERDSYLIVEDTNDGKIYKMTLVG